MMEQPIKQEGEYTCFMYTLLQDEAEIQGVRGLIVPPAEL
jgi:hypothetical protein